MKQLPENSILQKVRDGDMTAFHHLYNLYYRRLNIFAQKFVSEDQAKDMVQDCFINYWINRNKIEINTSFSAYLFTIIKNRCLKFLKEEQKKNTWENGFGLKLKAEELEYFIASEKSILEFDIEDRVKNAIGHLPEKCAEVFRESRFDGLSNKEIAAKHNITVKAVEKHISRALKTFREEFKDLVVLLFSFYFKKNI